MARVTICDMLSPLGRETRVVEVRRLFELLSELQFDDELYRVNVIRNGIVMDPETDFDVLDEDFLVVELVPRKDLIRTVALIAATALASTIIGPWAAGVVGWTTKVGTAVMSAVAVAGMAQIVNAVLPASNHDKASGSFGDRSNMYGWSVRSNTTREGDAVPRLFGQLTFPPKLIDRYIETIGDKQYFNGLYLVSDSAVDWIDSLTINRVDALSFGGVSIEYRYGAIDQTPVSNFGAQRHDQPISTKVESGGDWVTMMTSGNQATVLRVHLVFPDGLFAIDTTGKDAGSQRSDSWVVEAQYADADGVWRPFAGSPGFVENNTRAPYRVTFVADVSGGSIYPVRVRGVRNASPSDFTHSSELWVDYFQEEVPVGLSYPGRSLISIKALATDKLNGSEPLVECRARSGGSNPSDIVLAMLAECGISQSRIDAEAFDEWRQDCIDRSLNCDILFDTMSSLRESLDLVSTLGRARVERFGSRYSVIMDRPGQIPVQGFTFGVGNIDRDSFGIDTVPMASRANVIDVTYYPDSTGNQRKTFEVASGSYNTDETDRRTTLNLIGCRSLEQATRHAVFLLKCNQYLTLMPYWGADLDAIKARVGEIVEVSDRAAQWGESGLVVSGSETSVVLDQVVNMELGISYAVRIRDADDNTIMEREVVWHDGPTNTLAFVTPPSFVPATHDFYSFGEVGKTSRLVRLTAVQTLGVGMRRKLVALEYVPDVYDDAVSIITDDWAPRTIQHVEIADYIRYGQDMTIETILWASWSGASLAYTVSYKGPSDNDYSSVMVHDAQFEAVVRETGVYSIKIQDGYGQTVTKSYTVLGKLRPPGDVPWIVVEDGRIMWGAVSSAEDIDVVGYEIRSAQGGIADWALAVPISQTGLYTASPISVPSLLSGVTTIMIKACDSSGMRSSTATRVTVNLSDPSVENVINEWDQHDLGWTGTITGGSIVSGRPTADGVIEFWPVRRDADFWSSDSNASFWLDDAYTDMWYAFVINVSDRVRGSRLLLFTQFSGDYLTVEYRQTGLRDFWGSGYDDFWDNDSDAEFWMVDEQYLPWPGYLEAQIGRFDFRVMVGAGVTRGVLLNVVAQVDAPDVSEAFSDFVIESTGSRLPITRQYRSIKQVSATLSGGSTALSVKVIDKSLTGPLIGAYDFSHNLVGGVADVTITGVEA
jgi:hypothetical protein